jgi:Flp pilus assembly protein TadD
MRRIVSLTILVLAFAADAFAIGQARITGKITDAVTKKPIENAVVNVKAVEAKTFQEEYKAKKDGSYAIFLVDGTIKYEFTWSAPGYQPFKDVMKLKLGEPNVRDIVLTPAGMATATVPAGEIKVDPSIAAFNDGAQLANEGKDAEALAKFTEAVTAKPDLVAGWQAIARVQHRNKKWAEAINAATKASALDPEDTDMYVILFDAYTATGDKAKAAEMKGKMPANASVLFNDAAKAINSGKDSEAESLLKQAVAADEKFAPAYYELGMVYVRMGKNADAKANLQKYLELEPSGKDAATAKEMLKYVK